MMTVIDVSIGDGKIERCNKPSKRQHPKHPRPKMFFDTGTAASRNTVGYTVERLTRALDKYLQSVPDQPRSAVSQNELGFLYTQPFSTRD